MIPDLTKFLKPRGASLLALTLEGRRIEGVVLTRGKDGPTAAHRFETVLSLDPLTNEPELVGQELRNRLDEDGVDARRCVVGIPLGWALTLQTTLPEIPDDDIPGFLDIQAEKGFPYDRNDLVVATSRSGALATQIAVPRSHLTRLEQILAAARLTPLSFVPAIAALQPPSAAASQGALALLVGETRVDLQVASGGGLVALRALDGAIELDGVERRIDGEFLSRELRITLGELPEQIRNTIQTLRVLGRADWTQSLAAEIAPLAASAGLALEVREISTAESLATSSLAGESCGLEFLPPRVSPWMRHTARFSSRKVLWSTAAATTVVVLLAGAFLVQYIRLSILESRWRGIEPNVTQAEEMQQNIRKFRSWYDRSAPTLRVLRRLTEAFPEDGAVTLKTLEVKNQTEVACTGTALDNPALLKVLDRLREGKHFADVKVQQVRGRAPLQFTFSCHWAEGGGQ